MSASARLALFDLDNTLLSGDTDQLWCRFLIDEGVLAAAAFETASRDVTERYARAAISANEYCAFYAGTLAGRTAAQWRPLRDRFVSTVIAPRIPVAAQALVAGHREAADRLVLTTATNRFLTEPIAALLGIEALIASELEVEGGGFTGRNHGVLNMREGKVERLRAWLGSKSGATRSLAAATFYSDSINDLPLLSAVGRPVAVDPDDRLLAEARARGWQVVTLAR